MNLFFFLLSMRLFSLLVMLYRSDKAFLMVVVFDPPLSVSMAKEMHIFVRCHESKQCR